MAQVSGDGSILAGKQHQTTSLKRAGTATNLEARSLKPDPSTTVFNKDLICSHYQPALILIT